MHFVLQITIHIVEEYFSTEWCSNSNSLLYQQPPAPGLEAINTIRYSNLKSGMLLAILNYFLHLGMIDRITEIRTCILENIFILWDCKWRYHTAYGEYLRTKWICSSFLHLILLVSDIFGSNIQYVDGLVQDCGNSSALAMELLQSCTKPLMYFCKILSCNQSVWSRWFGLLGKLLGRKGVALEWCTLRLRETMNTLRPRQDGRHFPDDIIKCIFLNENVQISIKIPLKFVPKGPINNTCVFHHWFR